jgi:hypothetical protein
MKSSTPLSLHNEHIRVSSCPLQSEQRRRTRYAGGEKRGRTGKALRNWYPTVTVMPFQIIIHPWAENASKAITLG